MEDVVGSFSLVEEVSTGSCPGTIEHTTTVVEGENTITHATMTMNGKSCDDGGSMEVLPDGGAASAAFEGTPKDLVNDLSATSQSVIYGIERSGRDCGDRPRDKLREGTLVAIITPGQAVDIAGLSAKTIFRYMFVRSVSTNCIYTADLRPSASPSFVPTPEPPVTEAPPTTAATEATEPVPSPTPTPPADGGDDSTGTGTTGTPPIVGGGDADDNEVGDNDEDSTETPPGGDDADDDGAEDNDESPSPDDEGEPSPSDEDSVCFPADATVEVEDGSIKEMAKLNVGDRVLVADGVYSDVFMFTHKESSKKYKFVTITTSSGKSISATPGHYVYINAGVGAARTVKVGDMMTLSNGDVTRVESIKLEMKTGLYNPQTLHGDIMVNSIRATTFTRSVDMGSAQALLTPLRLVYSMVGYSSSIFDNGADSLAPYMPKGEAAF